MKTSFDEEKAAEGKVILIWIFRRFCEISAIGILASMTTSEKATEFLVMGMAAFYSGRVINHFFVTKSPKRNMANETTSWFLNRLWEVVAAALLSVVFAGSSLKFFVTALLVIFIIRWIDYFFDR